MKSKLQSLARRPFIRNVLMVASGTAASQAVAMTFAPIITRLYGPEAYGLQGLFISVTGLLATTAALGYPTAIVLPKKDVDAVGLVKLSLLIGFFIALLTAVALYFVGMDLLRVLNAEGITAFIPLIPLAMIISVIGNVLTQWLVRKKAFRISAKFAVISSLLIAVAKTGMGFFYPTAQVLIATNVSGSLFGSILTFFGWKRWVSQCNSERKINCYGATLRQLAFQHRDFPLLRMPQNLINAFSQSLPVLLLASYFGASAAGKYSIAITVLAMPANLIGGSVMSVFYPRVTEAIYNGENARALIIKATFGMAVTGVFPYLLVAIAGPSLFAFVFGQEWRESGIYAQWLSFWLFLQYINKPAVSAVPALRLQGGLLVYELFSTGSKIFALWLGFTIYKDAVVSIAFFSLFGIVAYTWLILWVVHRSGKIA